MTRALPDGNTGPNFIHPHPPHPWKYPSRGGGCIKGGAYKIPAAWGLKMYNPPEKCLLAEIGGRGGGVHIISTWREINSPSKNPVGNVLCSLSTNVCLACRRLALACEEFDWFLLMPLGQRFNRSCLHTGAQHAKPSQSCGGVEGQRREGKWFWALFSTLLTILKKNLCELGPHTLRDTPEPWQLEAPSPWPTIKQLKDARKGNRWPRKGNRWPP